MKIQEVVDLVEQGCTKFIGSDGSKRYVFSSNWAFTEFKIKSRPHQKLRLLTRDFARWAKRVEEDVP